MSAGAYTAMSALLPSKAFAAGAFLSGVTKLCSSLVSYLSAFVRETPKFKSHYLWPLVGKDNNALYDQSPINFLYRIFCPILLLQGLDDKVVPPKQARMVY